MSRPGVNYETVKQTALKLLSQGLPPSVQKIREVLNTGSHTTIAEHLKRWRDEHAQKSIHHLPAHMPKELMSSFEVLWQTAMEHAQNQLAEYKKTMDADHEAMLQKEREAEKVAANLELKVVELSSTLEKEVQAKQKLSLELAVLNERILKQEETHAAQKYQYEERLNRVYEEKDALVTENRALQAEIKLLQEKLNLQAETHKESLAKQQALQEQSENRWLRLIDEARLETKEVRKKIEDIRFSKDNEFKQLEIKFMNAQREKHEKETQLKVTQEQLVQVKQELKFLEKEYIQAQASILKLKEEQQLNIVSSISSKTRKIKIKHEKAGNA